MAETEWQILMSRHNEGFEFNPADAGDWDTADLRRLVELASRALMDRATHTAFKTSDFSWQCARCGHEWNTETFASWQNPEQCPKCTAVRRGSGNG